MNIFGAASISRALRNRTPFVRAFNRRPEGPGNILRGGGGGEEIYLGDAGRLFLLAVFPDLIHGQGDRLFLPQRETLERLFQDTLQEKISVAELFRRLAGDLQLIAYHRNLLSVLCGMEGNAFVRGKGIDVNAHINSILSRPYIPEKWPAGVQHRRFFVPAVYTDVDVAADNPLLIGYGQIISQPSMVSFILEKAEIKPGDAVLEIGSGSGWVLAQLANLVGENGRVFGVEYVPELRDRGKLVLKRLGYTNIEYFEVDEKGFPEGLTDQMADSIDTIIISADVPWDGRGHAYILRLAKYVKQEGRIIFPADGCLNMAVGDGITLKIKTLLEKIRFDPLIIERNLQQMLEELLLPHGYTSQLQALLGLVGSDEGIKLLQERVLSDPGQQHLHAIVMRALQNRAQES